MTDSVAEKKTQETPTKEKVGTNKLFLLAGYLLKIIYVAALAGLAYFYWQQQIVIAELADRQNQLASENQAALVRLQNVQQEFENINNTEASAEILFNQQNARLDNLNEELVSIRLGMNASQTNGIWQLVETASLLRLANQYLELNQDLSVALSLYRDSQAVLEQIDDPSLDRIKSLLASDIRNLSNSREVDIEGFYMRLSDISQQLDTISLGTSIEPSSDFLEETDEDMGAGFINGVKNFLSRYFTVRRLESPLDIPLNDQQLSFLHQNMQLQIEQAKLALLQGRQSLYQDSLSNVLLLVQQNIAEDNQQKDYIVRELSNLQDENILLDLPRLSEALTLLEALMSDLTNETGN